MTRLLRLVLVVGLLGCQSLPPGSPAGNVAVMLGVSHPSTPSEEVEEWFQRVPLGLDKTAADAHFAARDNDSGHWESKLISSEMLPEGQRSVYEYYWVRTSGYAVPVRHYLVTFVAGTAVKFEQGVVSK